MNGRKVCRSKISPFRFTLRVVNGWLRHLAILPETIRGFFFFSSFFLHSTAVLRSTRPLDPLLPYSPRMRNAQADVQSRDFRMVFQFWVDVLEFGRSVFSLPNKPVLFDS